ncbi:ABC transporter permease [Streptomyces sp. RPT161]|uniref:ABC transporter permease n=1 Tax=Streptomyces sp. RPT161 TaxID=3015993 RepID=UPI0022B93757|nr:ABC transporter permease [Streptomyces sp. RPT161]
MFVAWRDLRFAKGRFALMGTVITLITLLVGLLSGLTTGLGRENTSAITSLPADHLAFAAPAKGSGVSFTDSRLREPTWRLWAKEPGVTAADPLGISMVKAEAGTTSTSLSAFGIRPGSRLAPGRAAVGDGRVVLSAKAADVLGVRAGDTVMLSGRRMSVAAVSGTAMYSHTPVVWTSLSDWQRLAGASGDGGEFATVIALSTTKGAHLSAADAAAGTRTVTIDEALSAIGSYTAENGSLQLMRGFLLVISALVIGAFFTVWTIQRSGDIAVLKALGASTGYLLRDALSQALVLLVLGAGAGSALAAALGTAVTGSGVPFVLGDGTVLIPALSTIALGVLGAGLAIRRITSVDPLTALGSAR